jgi:hypothetical protein
MNPLKVRRLTDITPAEEAAHRYVQAYLNREQTREDLCKVCPKAIWFTAFFDGTGNSYQEDGNSLINATNLLVKYSNIAKLGKFAHPSDKISQSRIHSFYLQGVGTPCDTGLVKDSGKGYDRALGMAAAAKGQDRISEMLARLEDAVFKHWPAVSQINLAVFGFSRGATQARAFVRQLNGKLAEQIGDKLFWNQKNMKQQRPEVVLYFMGIMDTVASTGYGGSRLETVGKYVAPGISGATGFLVGGPSGMLLGARLGGQLHEIDKGGHAAWAQDLTIPPYVQQCVHYIAGHEVREKFPSDSVRRDAEMAGNCVEYVYPGMHSDVGGGYPPSHPEFQEGRGNELARIPLCHMYIAAYTAGVPFKGPAEVLKSAGSLFEISPELEHVYESYMNGAPSGEKLEVAIVWHMNRYYEWRESRRRRLADGRLKPVQVDPYMSTTDNEWAEDVQAIAENQTGHFTRNVGVQRSAIFEAYQHKLVGSMKPEVRKDFDLFFDRYVHDSIAGFKQQLKEAYNMLVSAEWSRWSTNRKIFLGKRNGKFLYWRYEGVGTAIAQTTVENPGASDKAEEAAKDRQRRQWDLEKAEYDRMR